jgi:hypothetical protein
MEKMLNAVILIQKCFRRKLAKRKLKKAMRVDLLENESKLPNKKKQHRVKGLSIGYASSLTADSTPICPKTKAYKFITSHGN